MKTIWCMMWELAWPSSVRIHPKGSCSSCNDADTRQAHFSTFLTTFVAVGTPHKFGTRPSLHLLREELSPKEKQIQDMADIIKNYRHVDMDRCMHHCIKCKILGRGSPRTT